MPPDRTAALRSMPFPKIAEVSGLASCPMAPATAAATNTYKKQKQHTKCSPFDSGIVLVVCCSTLLRARSATSSTPRGREETTARGIAAVLVSRCGTNGGGFWGRKREERGKGRSEAEELQWQRMVQVGRGT